MFDKVLRTLGAQPGGAAQGPGGAALAQGKNKESKACKALKMLFRL